MKFVFCPRDVGSLIFMKRYVTIIFIIIIIITANNYVICIIIKIN